jgi:hypothetical protein
MLACFFNEHFWNESFVTTLFCCCRPHSTKQNKILKNNKKWKNESGRKVTPPSTDVATTKKILAKSINIIIVIIIIQFDNLNEFDWFRSNNSSDKPLLKCHTEGPWNALRFLTEGRCRSGWKIGNHGVNFWNLGFGIILPSEFYKVL